MCFWSYHKNKINLVGEIQQKNKEQKKKKKKKYVSVCIATSKNSFGKLLLNIIKMLKYKENQTRLPKRFPIDGEKEKSREHNHSAIIANLNLSEL